jgi:hypothetical protein
LGIDLLIIDILTSCLEPVDARPDLPACLPADWINAMLILLLIALHACVALPIAYCLLFEPIDARLDSRPPPVEPIVAHSDLPVEPIARPYRPSCRMRTQKSRISRPVDRFANRSDLRPPVDEPTIAHPDLRPCRMRISQSRILRPTCLPASIPSASSSLASVSTSTSASAPTSLIGSDRCLYCGERSCAKRWCVRYRDDLDTGRIRLDTRGRICLGHAPTASVVRMRIGISQRACVLEAEKRVQRLHSLPASATASVNITPVPARVSFSVSSPAAGPALGPALVPFVTPPSILPTNAVSASSPSPIGSLPSPTCSDLAAKHAEFECDHSLPASSILPADAALSSSPHASSMPSSMPNVSDTDFLIKLAAFRDALVCLSPAAFDAVVKVLAMPELSGSAQEALDLCLSPNEEYRIGALAFLIHESGVGTAYIERDQSGQVVRVALSTEAKDDDGNGEDSYTLPAVASESSSMPLIMDLWSSANVSAIRLVQKDSSFACGAPDSPTIRSAVSKAPWLVYGPSFTVRFTPIPVSPEPMVVPTPVPMFFYRPTLSLALSSAPPEPFPVSPPAFRPTPKPDVIVIGVIARLPKWVMDALCKTLESLEVLSSWVVEYWQLFLGVVHTPDLYTRLAALLELLDWSLRAQGLESLGVGWREYFATLR